MPLEATVLIRFAKFLRQPSPNADVFQRYLSTMPHINQPSLHYPSIRTHQPILPRTNPLHRGTNPDACVRDAGLQTSDVFSPET
jgi:hypothetical protein